MKVYTTASNAKRAATAMAAKHDNLDVAEKMMPADEGGFYATVHVNMGVASADVRAEAKVVPNPAKAVTPPAETLPLTDKDGKVGAVLDLNPNAAKDAPKNLRADGTEMTKDEVGTVARVVTPAEAPKPPKDNKTTKAIEMMSAKDGATTEELIKALDWQKHTVRGFVSLQNSKHKRGIATIRKDGVTSYKIG